MSETVTPEQVVAKRTRVGEGSLWDPDDKVLVSRTIEAVSEFCLAGDLNPSIVANRANYVDLLHALRLGRRPPAGLGLADGWRKTLLGTFVTDLLGGRCTS